MKKYLHILTISFLITSGCTSYHSGISSVYEDDLYYSPSDKPIAIAESYSPLPKPGKELLKEDNRTYSQLKSDYQNSESTELEDHRDFSSIQKEYTDILTSDSISDIDTMLYYNDQTGYWVNEFSGTELDKDYAERIARFHGPFRGVPYWSPLYDEIIFGSGFDYNVYIEGDYAFIVPDWSSPYYWDWRYGSFGHYNRFSFYGGWYGNSFGWGLGFGYPYYDWCYPYYG